MARKKYTGAHNIYLWQNSIHEFRLVTAQNIQNFVSFFRLTECEFPAQKIRLIQKASQKQSDCPHPAVLVHRQLFTAMFRFLAGTLPIEYSSVFNLIITNFAAL